MTQHEQHVRNSVRLYRLQGLFNLGKALAIVGFGAIVIAVIVLGLMPIETPQGSWVYETLGPDGAKVTGVIIMGLFMLMGLWRARAPLHDLRAGAQEYEAQLRSGVDIQH